jgi:excisionase family DNA binding protein
MEKLYPAVLTVKQLSEYLNVGINVAYELSHRKNFPTLRLGRKILIPREQLNEWINNQTSK